MREIFRQTHIMQENTYENDNVVTIVELGEFPQVTDNPKKRKQRTRLAELSKLARVKNHFTGEPCNCKFLKCFENITVHEKQTLIDDFVYKYETKDQQDSLYTVGGSKAAKM